MKNWERERAYNGPNKPKWTEIDQMVPNESK